MQMNPTGFTAIKEGKIYISIVVPEMPANKCASTMIDDSFGRAWNAFNNKRCFN